MSSPPGSGRASSRCRSPRARALILTTPDGGIETVDLTSFDNRDLLVTVLGDLLEKLRGLADGTHDLPEIIVDEPIIQEPPVIEAVAELEVIEEPLSKPEEIEMLVEEPPVSIEPEPVDPPVEMISPTPHDPVEYEPTSVPPIVEIPIFTPTVLSTSVLRRFREKVLRQRSEASRRRSEIRRLTEAQVHKMRSGAKARARAILARA